MNEIITFGHGYGLTPGIKVFVKSARALCEHVTVIASNLSPDLQAFLENEGVGVFDARVLSDRFGVSMGLSPYTLKVIFFYLYCKHYCKAKNIYLCDFTDIYFQRDPFLLTVGDKACVTSENCLVQDCQTNTTWIKHCYNEDIYGLLRGKEILNGGSILGKREAAAELLKEMCDDMAQIITRVGNYPNIDQASMTKVVHFDRHRYDILHKREIVNMAHTPNDTDFYYTYVVHQYDVNKPLMNRLYDTYK